jgi:GH25 family lysozyme M1 (1,4-beta-N-acetylmuramidase)
VSKYQGTVGYGKVARAGIRFVFVRATQGTSIKDPYYVEHVTGATSKGMSAGPYHFFDYTSNGTAQADFFVNTVQAETGFNGLLPPVVDVECFLAYGRADQDYAMAQLRAFLGEVYRRTGRMSVIYTSNYMWNLITRGDRTFRRYPLWVACWNCSQPTLPAGWKSWVFWQTGTTTIKGIGQSLDGDVFNGTDAGIPPLESATNVIKAINGTYLTSPTASLDLTGRDGVRWRYSTDGTTWSAWQPYSYAAPVVQLDLGADGAKSVKVQLKDPLGNRSPISTQAVVVDTTPPVLSTLTTSLPLGPMASTSGVPNVAVTWSASDATSGLNQAEITGACGSAAPGQLQVVTGEQAAPIVLDLGLHAGQQCSLSADASDLAGLTTQEPAPMGFRLALAQESNSHVIFKGPWRVATTSKVSGGTARYTTAGGATMTYHFTGTDVALIATKAPARGRARVFIDGTLVKVVDEYAPKALFRQRVFSAHLAPGPHTLTVTVSNAKRPASTSTRFSVDAFQVLVPATPAPARSKSTTAP